MAKVRVRDNQTGQIIEVDEEELGQFGLTAPSVTSTPVAPTIAPPVQQAQPEQKSILQGNLQSRKLFSGDSLLSNIINSVVSPFVQTGQIIAGAGAELLRQPQLQARTKSVEENTRKQQEMLKKIRAEKDPAKQKRLLEQSRKLSDQGRSLRTQVSDVSGENLFLSQEKLKRASTDKLGFIADQAKESVALASFGVPFGKGANVLSKLLLPGAAVGAAQSLPEAESFEDVVGGALFGAAGAGILGGVFKAGAFIPKITKKALGKVGDVLSIKSLRPSPSQQSKFFKETGVKLQTFIKDKKLQGAGFDKISKRIESLQGKFDDVVNSSGLKISSKSIVGSFNKEIQRLKTSIIEADKTKAIALGKIRDNIVNKYGKADIPASALTTERRLVDKGIKDFNLDEAIKGPLNVTRDILQNSIRDAAEKQGIKVGKLTLKEAGAELSKFYKVLGIAEKQQFLGGGASPIGLTGLLGLGGGGIVGGLPGAAVGFAATKAINNPRLQGLLSRAATATAGKIKAGAAREVDSIKGQVTSRIPGTLGELLQGGPTDQQENANIQQDIQDTGIVPQVGQQPVTPQAGLQGQQISVEQMQQVFIAEAQGLLSSDAADAIKKVFDLQEDDEAKLTESQKKTISGLSKTQDLVQTLAKELEDIGLLENPFLARLSGVTRGTLASLGLGGREGEKIEAFRKIRKGLRVQIARGMGEVGNLSEAEQEAALDLLPDIGMSQFEVQESVRLIIKILDRAKARTVEFAGGAVGITQISR